MRRGRPRKTRRASMRRGLTTYLRLSLTGDSKRGQAAAPFLVAWRYPPSWGGTGRRAVTPWVSAGPAAWAAESDGTRKVRGGRRAALSFWTSPPATAAAPQGLGSTSQQKGEGHG